ncbi:vacuolar protein sorting-associated protein 54 [Mycena pura]|uniref:Vacuolar protein sorting-associated protein 54 n=1 Tax=Mycena pura TaxID=153505 RepID=A0AAD6VT52_9AGAR|nr:vacuolar protein sorting-associated protein 54 [Mycena pura]
MSDHSSSDPSRPTSPASPVPATARPYRFTWDSTQKGPESVSGTTEGRDYFAGPSRLNLYGSSTDLALGAVPPQWSSSTHGFHAISTVLNNPHKRQAPPKAHSSLPAVVPADLPRVHRKDFDSYLRAITPEWERLEHSNQLDRETEIQLQGTSTPRASTSGAPFVQTPGRPLPPLDVVPSIFFQPAFNLADPRTFNAVTEQDSPDHDPAADPTAVSYSLPLLEKFSHYADTVEQHLVREISLRSASFFAALTNLHELQSESEECLDRVSKLRTLLKEVDEQSAKKGLEIVRKESRMRNLGKVREGVKFVGGVVEMTGVAKGLVAAGHWDQALGVLEDMGRLWEGPATEPQAAPTSVNRPSPSKLHGSINGTKSTFPPTPEERSPPSPVPPPPIPLSSLNAFSALPTHLRTLTMEIASSLATELVSVLRADLLERIGSSIPSSPAHNKNQNLKDRLRPLLQGLARTNGVREATLSWREVVLDEVRGVIRRHIPVFDGADEESRSPTPDANGGGDALRPGLAKHLQNMLHSDFLQLIQAIYKIFLNAVEGLQAQETAFIELLETTSPPNPTGLRDDLSDILSSAAELSNTQAAKLIIIRSEQHAALGLPEFFAFFNDSWAFVVRCEVICRKMIVGLRGVVISQTKSFLQTFHQARLTQSASLVENEQWEQIDATLSIQHVTDVLVDCAVKDVPELLVGNVAAANPTSSPSEGSLPSLASASLSPALSTNSMNGAPQSPSALPPAKRTNGASSQNKKAKVRLRIEERTFSAVAATTEVLSLILDYLRVIMNLSMLTTDTMSRVVEFLKAFNSRTCQVVLGAGAMRSAGLKHITAKHLALASQSLSIMIALIPYVRETFRRHLSQKQAVMLVEFDKLKRDYQEHQNEIHSKLIAIMGDRLNIHLETFQKVDWAAPQEGVNKYMSVLVQETVTLHKVLSRHLSAVVVEDVMAQVFAAIYHRLSEEYAKIVLPNEEARKGLLVDARFLHQKLSELKNVGAPSGMLDIVISELRVPQPASPAANAPNFNAKANASAGANASGSTNSRSSLANRLRWNSLAPAATANANGGANPSVNGAGAGKTTAPPVKSPTPSVNGHGHDTKTPTPPPPPPRSLSQSSTGFRQVEPASPGPRAESPLPTLPSETGVASAASVSEAAAAAASSDGAGKTKANEQEQETEVIEDPLGVGPATPRPGTPAPPPYASVPTMTPSTSAPLRAGPVPAPTETLIPAVAAPASTSPETLVPTLAPTSTPPSPPAAASAVDSAIDAAKGDRQFTQTDSGPSAVDNGIAESDGDRDSGTTTTDSDSRVPGA